MDAPRGDVLVKEKTETRHPPLYRVILHNDDYTPMDFVVWLLENVFHHTHDEAHHLTMTIHHQGAATAGIFSYDVARTKMHQVLEHAKKEMHPLQCSIEPTEG